MRVIVMYYVDDPGVATQKTLETHLLGDEIVTKSGVLEVRDRGKTIKAYAPGRWIEAWTEK